MIVIFIPIVFESANNGFNNLFDVVDSGPKDKSSIRITKSVQHPTKPLNHKEEIGQASDFKNIWAKKSMPEKKMSS